MYKHMHVYICIYNTQRYRFFSSLSFYGESTIPGTKRQPAILNLIDVFFFLISSYGMTSNDWESTGTSRHSHNTRSVPVPRSPPSTSCYFGSCRHQETWHNWKTSTTSTIEIHRSTNRLAEGRGAQSSNIERSTVALKASCVTPSGGDGVAVS